MFRGTRPRASCATRFLVPRNLIAQDYVQTKKIDTSRQYLASVTLAVSGGTDYWNVTWMNTNRWLKGDWFYIRVDIDKKIEFRQGQ